MIMLGKARHSKDKSWPRSDKLKMKVEAALALSEEHAIWELELWPSARTIALCHATLLVRKLRSRFPRVSSRGKVEIAPAITKPVRVNLVSSRQTSRRRRTVRLYWRSCIQAYNDETSLSRTTLDSGKFLS